MLNPIFFQRYKWFHELYKVHKMKNIHQGLCVLHNKYMLSSNFLFILYNGKKNQQGRY